jgi:hypothetical protein
MKLRALPAAQEIQRGSSNAIKSLLSAIAELQKKAAFLDDLVSAGIVAIDSKGGVYDPSEEDKSAFTSAINDKPDAPTRLSARATGSLAFLSWTIPKFQPQLAYAEVWELAAPVFSDTIDYVTGDFITYEGTVYRFTSDHAAAAWDASDVSAAGASDLVVSNANNRHQSPISSAIAPLDINGGTSYFWVRLVTSDGVAGTFSSSVGVKAQSIDNSVSDAISVISLKRNSNYTTAAGTNVIPFSNSVTSIEIDDTGGMFTYESGGEIGIPDDQGFTQFRVTGSLMITGSNAGLYKLFFKRNGSITHSHRVGNTVMIDAAASGERPLNFISQWMDITAGGEVIGLALYSHGSQTIYSSDNIGLQFELR